MTKTKKKQKHEKVEKFLYRLGVTLTIFLIIGIVSGKSALARINLEVQKLSNEVDDKLEENQSLVMKINEMASLENIQSVSEDMGLAYNNDNIKTIE